MAEPDTMYRVMILHMLDRAEHPLTNNQIVDFVLDRDITNYFNVQLAISDLLESEFITAESAHNDTHYRLTDEGRQTLELLSDKVTDALKDDIDAWFAEHHLELRQRTSVYSDYMKASGGGYLVRCRVKNNEKPVVDLTITVPDRAQAQSICDNWGDEYTEVYAALMDLLLK